MIICDTHTHLYVEEFDQDRDEVIKRAIDLGVDKFLLPAIDSSSTQRMLDLELQYPKHCMAMMGLHPTSVDQNWEFELNHVREMLNSRKFVAIGEIGIDLYWDKTFLSQQQHVFRKQLEWSKEMGLPVVIHSRDSFEEIFEILEEQYDERFKGVFHCFTGNYEQAERAISYNMKLGIGGVVTFKNGKIDQFLNQIDLKHIVLETDSPYLAPVPYRGKRNESVYIIEVLSKMSQIYNISIEEVAKVTSANSYELFGL